jgi:hypothetical protein
MAGKPANAAGNSLTEMAQLVARSHRGLSSSGICRRLAKVLTSTRHQGQWVCQIFDIASNGLGERDCTQVFVKIIL